MPRIIPEPRYFSIPSIEVGADVRMKRALNCWPWVRSFTHSPDAVIHSPAEMVAAWPMTVTRSRCPRAFARRTQKPFSLLWKVTRSTSPASTSWVDDSGCVFMSIIASSVSPLRAPVPRHIEVAGLDVDPGSRGENSYRRHFGKNKPPFPVCCLVAVAKLAVRVPRRKHVPLSHDKNGSAYLLL